MIARLWRPDLTPGQSPAENMQPMFPAIHNGGTTVNGVSSPPLPFVMRAGEKPY